jgi:hypothetical protein
MMMTWYSPGFLTFPKFDFIKDEGGGRHVKGYALNEDRQTHDLQHGKFLLLVHTVQSSTHVRSIRNTKNIIHIHQAIG